MRYIPLYENDCPIPSFKITCEQLDEYIWWCQHAYDSQHVSIITFNRVPLFESIDQMHKEIGQILNQLFVPYCFIKSFHTLDNDILLHKLQCYIIACIAWNNLKMSINSVPLLLWYLSWGVFHRDQYLDHSIILYTWMIYIPCETTQNVFCSSKIEPWLCSFNNASFLCQPRVDIR